MLNTLFQRGKMEKTWGFIGHYVFPDAFRALLQNDLPCSKNYSGKLVQKVGNFFALW